MPLPRTELQKAAAKLGDASAKLLLMDWPRWARSAQLPPDGEWTTWLLLGGRGSGKTRAGAEWVKHLAQAGVSPIALVGETMTEAMAVMVKGESGLLAVHTERSDRCSRARCSFGPMAPRRI